MATSDCICCAIVDGDAPSFQIDSDEYTVAFMDIAPATPGHALVVPRTHSSDLLDISPDDLTACTIAAQRVAARMDAVLKPDGLNLLNACRPAGWQTVFHFHIHVVPRWFDDPLELPWIPRPGDADQIAATAVRLRV